MQTKNTYILSFIPAIILNSYSREPRKDIIVDPSSMITNVDDFFEDYYSVPLETNDECLIAEINTIVVNAEKMRMIIRYCFFIN